MHKIIPLQVLAVLFCLPLVAIPYVPTQPMTRPNPNVYAPASTQGYGPYPYSYVQGSTIVTNYYDPYAGPDVGPGLSTSLYDTRNASLGFPLQSVSPVVPIYSGPQSIYTSALQQGYTGTPNYPPQATVISPPAVVTPVPSTYAPLPSGIRGGNTANEGHSLGHFEEPTYLYPGLVRFSIDRWIGSEYLYDLPSDIGVVVEVLVPKELSTMFNTVKIKDDIHAVFKGVGITPMAQSIGNQPPLPFFHLLAYVLQVEDAYALSISGRLLEAVTLPRTNFQLAGTWQAITWEKQDMVVSSKTQITEQLYETAKEIAMLFAEKVSYFKKRRVGQRQEHGTVVPVVPTISPFLHPRGPCCQ